MIKLSQKAQVLPPSPIRKLVPYALEAQARGTKVYHLNIGQPDIRTPQCALDAVRSLESSIVEYTHSAGNQSYREALAEFYSAEGREITPEDIIVTTGGSEAILFAMMAVCDPGDEIIVPEPFYANYNSFAIEASAQIVPLRTHIEDGFALPSIEEIEKLITPRTQAILICNPNNPTGYLYNPSELKELEELALKHNIYLISDEVYSDFCYDGNEHYSMLDLPRVSDRVIVVDSISKRYSMCGARIGALISRSKRVVDAALRMGQARLCAPYLGQIAAEAATRFTPQSYFSQVKDEYITRRNFAVEALNAMEGVYCPMPKGAFYCIASLPVDNAEEFAQWLLEEFSYQGSTVMLAPASGFYFAGSDMPTNQVRIAYVLSIDDLRVAMEALCEALKVYPNRTNR